MNTNKKWQRLSDLPRALEWIGFQPRVSNDDEDGDDEPTTEQAVEQATNDYKDDLI